MSGIEDLYVYNGGSVTIDTNGTVGLKTLDPIKSARTISLKSIHVQDKGRLKLDASSVDQPFILDATSIQVCVCAFFFPFFLFFLLPSYFQKDIS